MEGGARTAVAPTAQGLLCSQWEPACQTPQPTARAHSAPGSGTNSRPGSIRRKLQPSGKPAWEWTGWEAGGQEAFPTSVVTVPGCPFLDEAKLLLKGEKKPVSQA